MVPNSTPDIAFHMLERAKTRQLEERNKHNKTHTHTKPCELHGISEVVCMLVCDCDGFDPFISF